MNISVKCFWLSNTKLCESVPLTLEELSKYTLYGLQLFDLISSLATLKGRLNWDPSGRPKLSMLYISIPSLPFILHILVELPAAFAFALFPSATLLRPQPEAHALIRQYGLLLLSTNMIAALFVFRHHKQNLVDDHNRRIEAWVAGSLAVYHLGPLVRAGSRHWKGVENRKRLLGKPWVHAIAHGICLIALAGHSLKLW